MIGLLVLAITVSALLASKALYRSYFSPLGVLSGVWGISLFLICTTSYEYQSFRISTWLYILLSWGMFLLGTLTSAVIQALQPGYRRVPGRIFLSSQFRHLVMTLGLISLLGSIRLAFVILDLVGADLFFTNKLEVRTLLTATDEYSTGKISLVFEGITLIAALLGGVSISIHPRFVWAYLPLLSAVIHDIFFIGRAHMIYTTLLFVSALTCSAGIKTLVNRKNALRIIPALLLILCFFLVPMIYTGQYRSSVERYSWLPQNILQAFQVAQNWYGLDSIVDRPAQLTWGVNSFFFVVRSLNLLGYTDTDPRLKSIAQEEVSMPDGATNKYTIIADIYADFGIWGIIIFFYTFGFLSSRVFSLYKKERQLWQVGVLPFVYTEIVFSLSGNALSGYAFTFALLVVVLLSLWVGRKSRGADRFEVSSA